MPLIGPGTGEFQDIGVNTATAAVCMQAYLAAVPIPGVSTVPRNIEVVLGVYGDGKTLITIK